MSEFDASVPDHNLPHPDGDPLNEEPIPSPGVLCNQSDPRAAVAIEGPATHQQGHPTPSGLDLDQNEDPLELGQYPNSPPDTPVQPPVQIRLYRQDDRLMLALPAEVSPSQDPGTSFTWADLLHQLQHRLNSSEPFWQPDMAACLVVRDRLLDEDQLQTVADILTSANLRLQSVETNRRLTAIIAATAGYSVEQNLTPPDALESEPSLAEPLYLQTTLRSGVEICHPGSVIVYGDTNPGSSIIAHGDVLVWGRLRGNAHAGATGNVRACIMTLQLEPPAQLRIAAYRARAPKPLAQFHPEVAYVTNQSIRIARATDFSRRIEY